MSIDYQLYQMPITTQIVIPHLLPLKAIISQPVTPDSFALSTPPKLTKTDSQLSWKKKHSAFKKFRDRNTHKNVLYVQSQSQQENRIEQRSVKMYRLSQKCRLIEYIDLNKGLHKVNDGPLCYFDPNLAPLYGDGSCEGISNELMTLDVPLGRTVSRSTIKIQHEKYQSQYCKIESLPSKRTSQINQPQIPIQRGDDPFIIIRHNSPQKSKTKLIRKEKQKTTLLKKQHIVKESESVMAAMELKEIPLPPFDTFRSDNEKMDRVEGSIEAIEIELSQLSDSQSDMEWQQQKFISCD